jgi:putative heme-binding domain-containing protein
VPPMTAFRSLLKDDELAAVLTFVRNTWGNQAAVVLPETVGRVREATRDRTIFWKPDELLAEHPLEEMFQGREPSEMPKEFSNELLEKELLAADPAELARVAMDSGNVQRGMKVFYESSAACFACHDPPKGAARLGPDLTSLKTTLSPEQLVNALLRPSELIDKAYAQVTVLDVDGQVRMGIRVEENETQIVLRNLAAPDPITITKDEIDEIQESAVSLMPENLMRQLKSRKEFDDLLRYVLEVRRQ